MPSHSLCCGAVVSFTFTVQIFVYCIYKNKTNEQLLIQYTFHFSGKIERGLESLHRTREQVRQAYVDIDADVAELLREDSDAVINISVSFDGTWQKRGFTGDQL